MVTLRPATPEDSAFLASLYASTRLAELAATGWAEEQKAQFCQMQFAVQTMAYRQQHPSAAHSVIEADQLPVGRMIVDRSPGEVHLIDISLMPEHRGRGIGTALLQGLQMEASSAGQGITLHVEKHNPALRLYERLGFVLTADLEIYQRMEWRS